MKTNLDKYKEDLKYLIDLGKKINIDLELESRQRDGAKIEGIKHKIGSIFFQEYQKWYSESYQVIKQLLPDRLDEFENLYKEEGKRKVVNNVTFTIQDWIMGVRSSIDEFTGKRSFFDFEIATMRFNTQLDILKAAGLRFESSLFDIKQILQADLFDSELEAARELAKNGFLRGAGAIAGVVLEKHLEQVCINHKVEIKKKDPSTNDLNDLLKTDNILEVDVWRFIQRLNDLRNLCDHNKKKEPTVNDVTELIDGVEKILKTVF